MGFNKMKRRLRLAVDEWGCLGFFGYGHGRAAAQFGEDALRGRSVCQDICKKADDCRRTHHIRMDARYPQVSSIVAYAARSASKEKKDVAEEVVYALERAAELDVEEAQQIVAVNQQFGVEMMTDHYRSGQFENIQNGVDGRTPEHRRPLPSV